MSEVCLSMDVWVPIVTVLAVLVTSGIIIALVRHLRSHLRRKYQERRRSKDIEAKLEEDYEITYSKGSLPESFSKESIQLDTIRVLPNLLNSSAVCWKNEDKIYIRPSQPRKPFTSDTSDGKYEIYLFE